jgi:hypothetical protein
MLRSEYLIRGPFAGDEKLTGDQEFRRPGVVLDSRKDPLDLLVS